MTLHYVCCVRFVFRSRLLFVAFIYHALLFVFVQNLFLISCNSYMSILNPWMLFFFLILFLIFNLFPPCLGIDFLVHIICNFILLSNWFSQRPMAVFNVLLHGWGNLDECDSFIMY